MSLTPHWGFKAQVTSPLAAGQAGGAPPPHGRHAAPHALLREPGWGAFGKRVSTGNPVSFPSPLQLDSVMARLPKQRRTGLFSATQTQAVQVGWAQQPCCSWWQAARTWCQQSLADWGLAWFNWMSRAELVSWLAAVLQELARAGLRNPLRVAVAIQAASTPQQPAAAGASTAGADATAQAVAGAGKKRPLGGDGDGAAKAKDAAEPQVRTGGCKRGCVAPGARFTGSAPVGGNALSLWYGLTLLRRARRPRRPRRAMQLPLLRAPGPKQRPKRRRRRRLPSPLADQTSARARRRRPAGSASATSPARPMRSCHIWCAPLARVRCARHLPSTPAHRHLPAPRSSHRREQARPRMHARMAHPHIALRAPVCRASCPGAPQVRFLRRHGGSRKVIVYAMTCAAVDHLAAALPRLPQVYHVISLFMLNYI
jgi:hypothetical protein